MGNFDPASAGFFYGCDMRLNALNATIMRDRQYQSEVRTYEIEWGGLLDTATVSSSTWGVDPSGTVGSAATAGTVTSCTFTADSGDYELENVVVASDGQTHVRYFRIEVLEDLV